MATTGLPVVKRVDVAPKATDSSKNKDKSGSGKRAGRSAKRTRSYAGLRSGLKRAAICGGEYLGGNALGNAYAGYRARIGKPVPKLFGIDIRLFASALGVVGSLWDGKGSNYTDHLLNASLGLGSSWTGEQATRAGTYAAEKWGVAPVPAAGIYIGNVGAAEDRRERRAARVDRRIERLEAKKAKYDSYDDEDEDEDNNPRRVIVIRQPVQQAQGPRQGVNVRSPVQIRRPTY